MKQIKKLGIFALLFFVSNLCAQDSQTKLSLEQVRKLPPEEINQLSEETLNPLPAEEIFSLIGLKSFYASFTPISLYVLFYAFPSGKTLEEQIKDWQKDKGFDANGVLTVEQFNILMGAMSSIFPPRVYFIGTAKPYNYGDYVTVTGTWEIIGDNYAFPVSETEIVCDRTSMSCSEETLLVDTHDTNANGQRIPATSYSANTLSGKYDVISWSENELIANSEGTCRNTTLTINLLTEETSQITRNGTGSCNSILSQLRGSEELKLDSPRVSILRPSFDTQKDFFNELDDYVRSTWSSSFMKYFSEIIQ